MHYLKPWKLEDKLSHHPSVEFIFVDFNCSYHWRQQVSLCSHTIFLSSAGMFLLTSVDNKKGNSNMHPRQSQVIAKVFLPFIAQTDSAHSLYSTAQLILKASRIPLQSAVIPLLPSLAHSLSSMDSFF